MFISFGVNDYPFTAFNYYYRKSAHLKEHQKGKKIFASKKTQQQRLNWKKINHYRGKTNVCLSSSLARSLSFSGSWLSLSKEIKIACVNPGFRERDTHTNANSSQTANTAASTACAQAPRQSSDRDTIAALILSIQLNLWLARLLS